MGALDYNDIPLERIERNIKNEIRRFIIDNYRGHSYVRISSLPNVQGKFEAYSRKRLKVKNLSIEHLTNGLFVWSEVKGDFDCSNCAKLKSLEGAPKIVGGSFICSGCRTLTSLVGAPQNVNMDFNCSGCVNLTNLKGSPQRVGNNLICNDMRELKDLDGIPFNITGIICKFSSISSLNGSPEHLKGSMTCSGCYNLRSLKGAPTRIGGNFNCSKCGILVSLEGGPQSVDGYYDCSKCYHLSTLKGAPIQLKGEFICEYCKNIKNHDQFSVDRSFKG